MAGLVPRLSGSSLGDKTGVKTSPSRDHARSRIRREYFDLVGRDHSSPRPEGDCPKGRALTASETRVGTASGRNRRESFWGSAALSIEPDSRGLDPAIQHG